MFNSVFTDPSKAFSPGLITQEICSKLDRIIGHSWLQSRREQRRFDEEEK